MRGYKYYKEGNYDKMSSNQNFVLLYYLFWVKALIWSTFSLEQLKIVTLMNAIFKKFPPPSNENCIKSSYKYGFLKCTYVFKSFIESDNRVITGSAHCSREPVKVSNG